jgi:hypothetical protein
VLRKFIASLLALPLITAGISAANAASAPWSENFDAMQSYSGVDFDGNITTLVTDQPAGEGFTSGKAIKMETQAKAWAGTKFVLPNTSSFISTANSTASLSLYSPDSQVRCFVLKVESAGGSNGIERKVTVAPGWQTINVNYALNYNPNVNYFVAALMPDFFGVGCNGPENGKPVTTWYVDNISFPGARDAAEVVVVEERSNPSKLINFEPTDTSGYSLVDFNGATASIVTDAPENGSIDSTKAMKVESIGGTSGTSLISLSRAASLISQSGFVVKANIHAPVSGKKIMLKIESIDHPSQIVQVEQTSVAGWKTYSFNFEVGGNLTQDYPRAAIFFDFLGDGSSNPWYLDDLAFNGAVGASITGGGGSGGGGNPGAGQALATLLTFEGDDPLGILSTAEAVADKPQGFFGGASAVITEAPAGGLGGNVLAITKSGAPWAGINALVSLNGSFRYSDETNTKVTFNYYSPKSGSPVGLELYNGATMAVQMIQTANAGWNNISFDLASASAWSSLVKYDKLVIFPDFQVDAANEVFYIDNLAVNGAVTPEITIVPDVPVEPAPKVKPSLRKAASVSTKAPKAGVTLTASKGVWSGSSKITYKYTWYRCAVVGKTTLKTKPSASSKCAVISGKTSSSLKLTKSDKGKYIRVMITAKNAQGFAYSMSKTTTKKVG